jgi:hypothetical protein
MAKVMEIDVGPPTPTWQSCRMIIQQLVALDSQIQLLIPDDDVDDPEISIVIPP